MEASSHSRGGRGLCKNSSVGAYSQKTHDMLRLMMQESKLTNLQRKHINESLRNGAALPLPTDPRLLPSPPQPKTSTSVQRRLPLPGRPQRRSAEACCSKNSYSREKFCPGPTRDLEEEKRRLQNIMAMGEEEPTSPASLPACWTPEVMEERDQYLEVLDEIEVRRRFLADMASLGQEKQYIHIINTEISQKIRELKLMDKSH